MLETMIVTVASLHLQIQYNFIFCSIKHFEHLVSPFGKSSDCTSLPTVELLALQHTWRFYWDLTENFEASRTSYNFPYQ